MYKRLKQSNLRVDAIENEFTRTREYFKKTVEEACALLNEWKIADSATGNKGAFGVWCSLSLRPTIDENQSEPISFCDAEELIAGKTILLARCHSCTDFFRDKALVNEIVGKCITISVEYFGKLLFYMAPFIVAHPRFFDGKKINRATWDAVLDETVPFFDEFINSAYMPKLASIVNPFVDSRNHSKIDVFNFLEHMKEMNERHALVNKEFANELFNEQVIFPKTTFSIVSEERIFARESVAPNAAASQELIKRTCIDVKTIKWQDVENIEKAVKESEIESAVPTIYNPNSGNGSAIVVAEDTEDIVYRKLQTEGCAGLYKMKKQKFLETHRKVKRKETSE